MIEITTRKTLIIYFPKTIESLTAYFPSVKTRVLSALEIFKRISKKYTVHGYYTGDSDGIRELENAEEEVRKLKQQGKELANFKECHAEEVRGDKRTEPLQSASKVQTLQAFLVPQGTSTSTIVQHYMTLTMLCRTDFCGIVKTFKNIYDKYGIERADYNIRALYIFTI